MINSLLLLDTRIFEWLNSLVGKFNWLDGLLNFLSVYLIYLIPIFLVALWFYYKKGRETSLRSAVAGVIGWRAITPLIAKLWFRERPIDNPLIPSKEIVFHRPTYSFPSDHALFLFALATGFYLAGEKKIAYYIYVVALVVSLTRIIVGVHFLGDVVVGWIIGGIIAWLAWRYRGNLDIIFVKPFVQIAKWLKMY